VRAPEKPPQLIQEEVLEKWGLRPFPVGEIHSPLPKSAFSKENKFNDTC